MNRVHIVQFRWHSFTPHVMCYDGTLMELPLSGNIALNISSEKRCVGSFGEEYRPCPFNRSVLNFHQCSHCAGFTIPQLGCVFEPKCPSTTCQNTHFCGQKHAVYIAFFRTAAKVGMTSLSRLNERLTEQGADAYAVAAVRNNRYEARMEERRISRKMRILQHIPSERILGMWSWPLSRGAVEEKFQIIAYGLERAGYSPSKLTFLERYPLDEPLRRKPRLRKTAGYHQGTVVGVKGKFLLYEQNGLYALNLYDAVGRFITRGSHPTLIQDDPALKFDIT